MLLPTIAGQQAAGKEDAIIRSTEQTIQYCLLLGFLSGGSSSFRKRAGTDLLPKPGRRHLFTDPGIPLSFPLSHRHSDRDPERPGTHRPMPDSEPRRPWNPNPLRDLRNPPHGIRGYLFGLLLSQLIITGLNLIFLHKSVKFRFPAVEWIVLPCCGMILGCGCGLFLYRILSEMKMSGYIALFGSVSYNRRNIPADDEIIQPKNSTLERV